VPVQRFGKYVLGDRLGKGGMAEIYFAWPVAHPEQPMVIKKMIAEFDHDEHHITMFLDEARLMSCLLHPNIVQIFDMGVVEGQYFIAMEYVDGRDLHDIMDACRAARIRMPEELCLHVVGEILEGLDYIHHVKGPGGNELNIIHRDVSPSNLLISYGGEVKLGDFGIAKTLMQENKTRAGYVKGKLGYMSPEQVMGQPLDARSDIFIVGIVLYEMLSSDQLFPIENEYESLKQMKEARLPRSSKLMRLFSEGMIQILGKALAKEPQNRFGSASEMAHAIHEYAYAAGLRANFKKLAAFLASILPQEREKKPSVPGIKVPAPDLRDKTPTKTEQKKPKTKVRTKTRASKKPGVHRYVLRDGHGRVIGPVGLETLVNLIRIYNISPITLASRDNQKWLPLDHYPELFTAFETPPESSAAAYSARPKYAGTFAEVSVPRLFFRMAAARATGKLVLSRAEIKKDVYLRDGFPEFVQSNIETERIGEFLLVRGVITRAQLNEALDAMESFGGRLGDTLTAMRLIKPHDLFALLAEQVKEKLLEVYSWTDGRYEFYAHLMTNAPVYPLGLGSFALIAEGIRKGFAVERLEPWLQDHSQKRMKRVSSRAIDADNLRLQPLELKVARSLDGQTMEDMIAAHPTAREQIVRTVFMLHEVELVAFT
jgi:serine/threonine-protein kinase